MPEPPYARHPLDADEDGVSPASQQMYYEPSVNRAYQPLLQYSIYTLMVSGILVVLTGIATGNARPMSAAYNTALSLNRLSVLALLIGFIGLLVAYRIHAIQNWIATNRKNSAIGATRSSAAGSSAAGSSAAGSGIAHGGIVGSGIAASGIANSGIVGSGNVSVGIADSSNLTSGVVTSRIAEQSPRSTTGVDTLAVLALINAGMIAVCWISMLATMMLASQIIGWLLIVVAIGVVLGFGLLVNMAIWHQGVMRAYAVGVVAAIFLISNQGFGLMAFQIYGGAGGTLAGIAPAVMVTVVLLAGMLSATYVRVLQAVHSASSGEPSRSERE